MEVEIAAPGRVREGGLVVVKPAEGMTERCATGEALKNIDAETLQSVDGIKEGEALESSCVDVEAELQPFQGIQQILDSLSSLSPPINAPNDGGVNMETENSIPISVLEADLFDIQIRESDEAVKTYGNNAKFKGFQSDVINFQSTSPDKEKSATTTMKGNEPDQSNQPPHRAIWKPPLWLILKVNFDDAIFREQNSVNVVLDMGGGLVLFWRSTIDVIVEGSCTNYIDTMFQEKDRAEIGVIILECQGKGLAHMAGIIPLPLTVIELETLAILKTLQFDTDLSLEYVTPEGVLEIAINTLNANSQSLESFGLLSRDVKCFPSLFHCIRILEYIELKHFPFSELVHLTTPIGATFLKQHNAQKKIVEPSVGIAKRPRVEPTVEDVPDDPITAVYDDDDEDEDEDDADVDVVATSPSTASPSFHSMVERVLETQSSQHIMMETFITT
nr:hypothetical protein CFP56_55364 [Quercus suber]